MARQGKIARLPLPLREELNHRLSAGVLGPQLLPWLNSAPEVQAVLNEFYGGAPINAQNLSDWRHGGYEDWEEKNDRTHRIKELASYAVKLAAADGGSIAEGVSAIASGELMCLMEAATAEDAEKKLTVEDIGGIVDSLVKLRGAEAAKVRGETDREKLKQKDQELQLAREKFQRDKAEAVLQYARDEIVQRIAASPADHSAQLEAVGKHLFGDLWK